MDFYDDVIMILMFCNTANVLQAASGRHQLLTEDQCKQQHDMAIPDMSQHFKFVSSSSAACNFSVQDTMQVIRQPDQILL